MTRIGRNDQVLLLLQEQIERLARDRSSRGGTPARIATPDPMMRVRALAGRASITEDEVKRALVRGLLTRQLGDAIANDPAFQAVADEVLRIIGDTPEGRDLLDRALKELADDRAT